MDDRLVDIEIQFENLIYKVIVVAGEWFDKVGKGFDYLNILTASAPLCRNARQSGPEPVWSGIYGCPSTATFFLVLNVY